MRRPLTAMLLLTAAVLPLAGCDAVAVPFVLLKTHKVNALHEPAPGRLAVLAEPAAGLSGGDARDPRIRAFCDQLAATTTGHLRTNLKPLKLDGEGVATKGQSLVPPARIIAERERDTTGFAALPLDRVAVRLGADRLVYVELTHLTLPDVRDTGMTGALVTPVAAGTVRIVDRDGRRVFPRAEPGGFAGDAGGQPFAAELDARRVGEDAADPATLRRALADQAGLAVARMFYDWTGRRPGDEVYEQRRKAQGRPQPGDRR